MAQLQPTGITGSLIVSSSASSVTVVSGSFRVNTAREGLQFYNGTNYTDNKITLSTAQNMQFSADGAFQFSNGTVEILRGNQLTFRDTDNTSKLRIENVSANTGSGDQNNTRLGFKNNQGTEIFSISGSGNIGIGVTSAMQKFDVDGTAYIRGGTYQNNKFTGDSESDKTDVALIIDKNKFIYTKDGNVIRKLIGKTTSELIEIGQSGTGLIEGIKLMPGTAGGFVSIFNNSTEYARFTGSDGGRLGIGTGNPAYNLDVVGSTNGIIRAKGSSIGRLSLQNDHRHYSISTQGDPGTLYLGYDETAGKPRILISSVGNVAIGGGFTPSHRLHISGNIALKADHSSGSEDFSNIIGTRGRTSIKDVIADASYEDTPFINTETFNAFAGADKWAAITASNVYPNYVGSNPPESYSEGVVKPSDPTDPTFGLGFKEAFRVGGATFQPYFSESVQGNDLDEIVIEIDHTNEPLRYHSLVGIQFTNPSWRARRIKIEAYTGSSGGTPGWVTGLDINDHNETTVAAQIDGAGQGIQKTKFTLGRPHNSGSYNYIRIAKIFGYDFKGVSSGQNDDVKTGTYYLGKHDNSAHYGTIYPATGSAELGKSSDIYSNIYADNLRVKDKIYHLNDSDTYIDLSNDDIKFYAGAVPMLQLSELGDPTSVIVNEGGNNVDFRVEGDTDVNLLFTNADTNKIGIGTNSPAEKLTVAGDISASGDVHAYGKFIDRSAGTLLKIEKDSWTTSPNHDILYNGWNNGTDDYVYLKAGGNSATNHGVILVSDVGGFYVGNTDIETGGINATGSDIRLDFRVDTSGNVTASGNITASGDITALNISASGDIIADSVIADLFSVGGTTLIETETIVISGSNIFGETNDNTHEFIGNITASGNLSASVGSTASFGAYFGDGSNLTGVQTVIDSSSFAITGSDVTFATVSASNDLYVSGTLTVESSGSTIFEVIGDTGQLFSIDDGMSGSLFAVSDVSGLPILEVFSDDTIKLGSFNDEAIIISGSQISSNLDIVNNITSSGNISSSGTITAGTYVNLPFTATGISGSLGTNASLIRSLTATAISGAFEGQTGSFVANSETSSFALSADVVANSATSSFALSADVVANSSTSSFALSSDVVANSATSSFALSSDVVANSSTSSFALSSDVVANSSTSSFALSSDVVANSSTSSFALSSDVVANSSTSSFALSSDVVANSSTSSFALSADVVANSSTSSFALSADVVANSSTSSFALSSDVVANSATSSFALSSDVVANSSTSSFALSADVVANSSTSSFALSADVVANSATSSFALSSDVVANSATSSFALSSDVVANSSTSSFALSADVVANSSTSSFALSADVVANSSTSSFALSADVVANSATSSFALSSDVVANSATSSFALSADVVANSATSSFVVNSQTASFAITGSDVTFATISASNDLYVSGTLDVLQSSFTISDSDSTELEVVGNISASGQLVVHTRKLDITTAVNTYSGDVVYFGSFQGNVTQGSIIRHGADDGIWRKASNEASLNLDLQSAYQLLGIALGDNVSDGVLIRGFYHLPTSPEVGKSLYIGTDGAFTQTVPSNNGDIVRVLGNVVSLGSFYFNPSSDWIIIDA